MQWMNKAFRATCHSCCNRESGTKPTLCTMSGLRPIMLLGQCERGLNIKIAFSVLLPDLGRLNLLLLWPLFQFYSCLESHAQFLRCF